MTSKIIFPLFLTLNIISSTSQALQFNSSGYFTIVQFTDFHYGISDSAQAKTLKLQKSILELVKPDLAVVSGDAVSIPGEVGSGWFASQWKVWTQPFVDAKVPYAYTLGNHDDEGDLSRRKIVQLDQTNSYSMRAQSEGIEDTANFRIPVYSSQNDSQLAAHLWVLDSGSESCANIDVGYGCIEDDVIEWYNNQSQKIKDEHGTNVHHLAYFHIALPEWINLLNEDPIYGTYQDGIGCPVVNTGFFAAAKNNGDITAMFVGHDHNNDFGGWHEGIELVYGRKSGYHNYGKFHGARVVVLKENYDSDGKLYVTREHYIVDASGSIEYPTSAATFEGTKQQHCLSGDLLFSQVHKVIAILMVLFFCLF